MIQNFAYILFLGKPLIMYGGLSALTLLLCTAIVGFLNYKRITIIPFRWHLRLAILTVIIALMHGILGLSVFFNF